VEIVLMVAYAIANIGFPFALGWLRRPVIQVATGAVVGSICVVLDAAWNHRLGNDGFLAILVSIPILLTNAVYAAGAWIAGRGVSWAFRNRRG
jgi:hypothetical protein